jgi:hypothetical protein
MNKQDRVASFEEVVPFSEADQPCFDEIRQVLIKHGALNRFGICLLHDHFSMGEDEILVETVNPQTRTMALQPMRTSQVGNALETAWRFLEGQNLSAPDPKPIITPVPTQKCITGCKWEEKKDGTKTHVQTHKWGG